MNSLPGESSHVDWVINYLEINSRPASTEQFCRLRINNGQIKIDPAGITLKIGNETDQGLVLESDSTTYLGKISQRGNELVVRLQRADQQGRVVIVAKKSVCIFETQISSSPSGTFKSHLDVNDMHA